MITKKASLKQTIVLILGILFVLNQITTGIYGYVHNAPLNYVISTSVQYACMAAAMILAAFRKKTPALVLVIAAMILCFANQFIPPVNKTDPIYRTLYYMLEYILLIAYILTGDDQKRNSLLWCGLFIFSVGYSVYEIAKVLSFKDLVYLIHYLAFYLVGYSPDKWYERKTIPQNTQA